MTLRNLLYSTLVFMPMLAFAQGPIIHVPIPNPIRLEVPGIDILSLTGSIVSHFLYRDNAAAQEKKKIAIDSLVKQWTQRDKYISAVSGGVFSARIKNLSDEITNETTDLTLRNRKRRRFMFKKRKKRAEALEEIKLGLEPLTSNINRVEIGVSKVSDRMWQLAEFRRATLPYWFKLIELEAHIALADKSKNILAPFFNSLPLR